MSNEIVTQITDIIVRVCAILLCITFHELAHGYTAYLLGDNTAKNQGRLSLNPIAHIDLIGLACMFIAGIGWAKPVPVNPGNFRMHNKKVGMAITAIAGPLVNFLMSFICIILWCTVTIFTDNMFTPALSDFLLSIALMGLGLGIFNLIPIPPLDGSKVLMMFMPHRVIEWVWRYEGFIRFGFLLLVFFGGFSGLISTGMIALFQKMSQAVLWMFSAVGLI